MVAKVVKLAVLPAALGLASFRVYAMTEEKTDEQFSPRELSIYSTEPPALRYVEEKPGHLQAGFGLMRVGLQRYVRAVQNTCTSVKVGAVSLYQAGQDTYNFLRDPPPGFLPRVGIITVSGLAGLVLARKGSRLKRIGVPLALTTVGTAVCYPTHTVRVLKVTGKKVYTASSSVASAFRSKPKEEGIVPDASLENASEEVAPETEVVPQHDELPEKVPFLPEGESVSEDASVTEVAPVSGNSLTIDAVAEEVAHVSEDSSTSDNVTDVAPMPEVSPATDVVIDEVSPVSEVSPATDVVTEVTSASLATDNAQAEVVSLVEGSSVVPLTPVPVLAPEDVIPSEVVLGVETPPVDRVVELAPQEKTTPVSGDVALEAGTCVSEIVTEKAPVAEVTQLSDVTFDRSTLVDPVTPTEDATEVALLPDILEEVTPVSEVTPTEDALVLNTVPLSDVTLKEATSEDDKATEVKPLLDVAAEESSPVSEDSPAIEVSPAEVASLAEEVGTAVVFPSPDIAPEMTPSEAAVVTLVESSPAVDITSDVVEVVENLPESAAPQAEAASLTVEEATPPPHDVEEATPSPHNVEEATPSPLVVEEATPPPHDVEEATPPPHDVEEATPSPHNVEEATPSPLVVEEATPPPHDVEEATPPPHDVEEATPPPHDVEEATPPPHDVEEATPSPHNVEEATPPPHDVEEATPPPHDVEEATPPPLDVEEATPPPHDVEEATPPPLYVEETTPPPLNVEESIPPPAKDIPSCPPVKEKPRFDPDPSLLDHGQAHPEDADLYSTRG
ncbi:MICOS complex subunit MIC27 [Pangasianodon hypophthalmus]|uniref:MICOS complex subunit MIC27 n=1 Tax=Pangasianodon hypophthalmus TaxID=310915 RepID=UPI002307E6BF|nr:MICOS complex subunit MIC27 [Pangasianodon hypophthalmus]